MFKALTQAQAVTPNSWQQYVNLLTKQRQRVR